MSVIIDIRDFFLNEKIIYLIIGFLFGRTFADLIDSIISKLLLPLFKSILGVSLNNELAFEINGVIINYGEVLSKFIVFVISLGFVYFALIRPFEDVIKQNKIKEEERLKQS